MVAFVVMVILSVCIYSSLCVFKSPAPAQLDQEKWVSGTCLLHPHNTLGILSVLSLALISVVGLVASVSFLSLFGDQQMNEAVVHLEMFSKVWSCLFWVGLVHGMFFKAALVVAVITESTHAGFDSTDLGLIIEMVICCCETYILWELNLLRKFAYVILREILLGLLKDNASLLKAINEHPEVLEASGDARVVKLRNLEVYLPTSFDASLLTMPELIPVHVSPAAGELVGARRLLAQVRGEQGLEQDIAKPGNETGVGDSSPTSTEDNTESEDTPGDDDVCNTIETENVSEIAEPDEVEIQEEPGEVPKVATLLANGEDVGNDGQRERPSSQASEENQ